VDPRQGENFGDDEYCAMSARLAATFRILAEIHRRGEKALIFVESLDMQYRLGILIKRRFRLDAMPMVINGGVLGPTRQRHVDVFQDPKNRGFDVMILSPKAGGVGLTITAANHVIHLSRWWNPAVEDQCTDRIYRMGQDRPVHVYYPMAIHPSPSIADKSFDLQLNDLLERKRDLSRDMLMPPIDSMADENSLYRSTVGGAGGPRATGTGSDVTIVEIDRMDPAQFEEWALQRMAVLGYRLNRTPVTGDGGADGVLVHGATKERIIIQCKHRQPDASCDDAAIDDLLRARARYGGADRLIALTNATGFSAVARQRAAAVDVVLVARGQVAAWPTGCF